MFASGTDTSYEAITTVIREYKIWNLKADTA